jgi:hypothetical protein
VPRQQRLECALLKAITARYVMSREGAARAQALERELLAELTFAVERGAPATLDPLLRSSWAAASSGTERRRVVIDQVASLTDTSAIAWHHRADISRISRYVWTFSPAVRDFRADGCDNQPPVAGSLPQPSGAAVVVP